MSAAAVDIAAVAAAAPQSDEELLSSMGLSQSLAAELLSSSEDLMERYGADTTVEKFLEAHCNAHVRVSAETATAAAIKGAHGAAAFLATRAVRSLMCVFLVRCRCRLSVRRCVRVQVSALQSYCEQRVAAVQQEGEQAIEAIKTEYAPQQ